MFAKWIVVPEQRWTSMTEEYRNAYKGARRILGSGITIEFLFLGEMPLKFVFSKLQRPGSRGIFPSKLSRTQGVREVQPPSDPEKIVVEKWCYIRRLYFQQQRFSKRDKFSFLLNFHQKVSKFSQNFLNKRRFSPKPAKI